MRVSPIKRNAVRIVARVEVLHARPRLVDYHEVPDEDVVTVELPNPNEPMAQLARHWLGVWGAR